MINLLPPETKQQIIFARRNDRLRKWLFAGLAGYMGIILILGAGYGFIAYSTSNWKKQATASGKALKDQKLEETQARISEMSGSIKLASDVLSDQVLFSKLLTQIGTTLPSGTLLKSLSIQSVTGGIDLTVGAKDYQTGTQAHINLSDPKNKVFDKADLVSINCENDVKDNEYPCTVTIRALFAKENSFQYSGTNKRTTP